MLIIGIYFNSQFEKSSKKTLTEKTLDKIEKHEPKLKEILEKNQKAQEVASNSYPALPPGANLLTRERIYTQDEIDKMSEDEFKIMLSDIARKLPKKSDIKELPPGALHQTPGIVIEAGRNLGVIKEVIKIHESYEALAVPFYNKCSKDDEGTTTVRALCLTNLIVIKRKNNENINTKDYPSEIVRLSKLVTDM